MRELLTYLVLISCVTFLSCNSNSLKQEAAERTIRQFLAEHPLTTEGVELSSNAIDKIEKANIYSQFYTSVRVNFKPRSNQEPLTLLFDFKRTTGNKWFLKTVEAVSGPVEELNPWLTANKNLNIPVE